MRWSDRLGDVDGVLADLEQQAEGLALSQRDVEVAELGRAELAQVDLVGRLHASTGRAVRLEVPGVGTLDGSLSRVGAGWLLLEAAPQDWVVRLAAVHSLRGLAGHGVPEDRRPVTARLTLASALRRLAEERLETVVHRADGSVCRGLLGWVGADFVDLWSAGEAGVQTVPFGTVAAVRSG